MSFIRRCSRGVVIDMDNWALVLTCLPITLILFPGFALTISQLSRSPVALTTLASSLKTTTCTQWAAIPTASSELTTPWTPKIPLVLWTAFPWNAFNWSTVEAIALLFLPKTVRSSAGVKENLASSGPEEFRIGSDLKIFILSKTQGSLRLTLD